MPVATTSNVVKQKAHTMCCSSRHCKGLNAVAAYGVCLAPLASLVIPVAHIGACSIYIHSAIYLRVLIKLYWITVGTMEFGQIAQLVQRCSVSAACANCSTAYGQTTSKVHYQNLGFPGWTHQHHLTVTFRHRVTSSSQILLCLFYCIDVLWCSSDSAKKTVPS